MVSGSVQGREKGQRCFIITNHNKLFGYITFDYCLPDCIRKQRNLTSVGLITKHLLLVSLQLDVLFGNLPEMVEFQVEFLKTLEDGTRLVPDLEKLERVDQFKVGFIRFSIGLYMVLRSSAWTKNI